LCNQENWRVRKIMVEYTQGWLAELQETKGNKQASWRADPAKAGASCTMGDIGVHAFNLAEYVTGLQVKRLCADISVMVEGRKLDDDGAVLLRFERGAYGIIVEARFVLAMKMMCVFACSVKKAALNGTRWNLIPWIEVG